jgi:nucleoside-diphosphate-sugar epimerase
MTRVLLTGGTGFIGTPTARALVDAGHDVHVAALGEVKERVEGVTYHDVDLLDPASLSAVVSETRPTHLLHLAWYVAHGAYWTSPENLRWLQAGIDLIRAFAEAGGTRAVLVGTCAEYEPTAEKLVEGVTPLRPTTLYAAAKAGLHLSAKQYFELNDVSFSWAHLFYLYGPRENASRLVPAAIDALAEGRVFECARPHDVRDFLHVDDVASGLAGLLGSNVEGDVNVCSGEALTVGELVSVIADVLGHPELVSCREPDSPASVTVGDSTRLRQEVGWTPRWTLSDGIAAVAQERGRGAG